MWDNVEVYVYLYAVTLKAVWWLQALEALFSLASEALALASVACFRRVPRILPCAPFRYLPPFMLPVFLWCSMHIFAEIGDATQQPSSLVNIPMLVLMLKSATVTCNCMMTRLDTSTNPSGPFTGLGLCAVNC